MEEKKEEEAVTLTVIPRDCIFVIRVTGVAVRTPDFDIDRSIEFACNTDAICLS
jgi:hypothetical protein